MLLPSCSPRNSPVPALGVPSQPCPLWGQSCWSWGSAGPGRGHHSPSWDCCSSVSLCLPLQNMWRDESPTQGWNTNFLMQSLLNIYYEKGKGVLLCPCFLGQASHRQGAECWKLTQSGLETRYEEGKSFIT